MPGEPNYLRLRANLTELQAAWQDRLNDSNVLLSASRPGSAIAMAVYALEIYLKTRICRRLDLTQLPIAFEVHQLDGLLVLSGLSKRLKANPKAKVNQNWEQLLTASSQITDYRYMPDATWTSIEAGAMLVCLTDPNDGVIPWLDKLP